MPQSLKTKYNNKKRKKMWLQTQVMSQPSWNIKMKRYSEKKNLSCHKSCCLVTSFLWQCRFILDLTEKAACLGDMSKSCNCQYQRHMFHQILKVIVFCHVQLFSSELFFPISYGEIKAVMNTPHDVCTSISLTAGSENKKQVYIDLLFTGNILMKPNRCACL